MFRNGVKYSREEMPVVFSEFFANKISVLEADLKISDTVHNGCKLLNSYEKNFMTEKAGTECLKELKTKTAKATT